MPQGPVAVEPLSDPDPDGPPRHELGEVSYDVEHRLLVEQFLPCVDDDGRVCVVTSPVRPASRVQAQVPVYPSSHVIVQILDI